MRSASVGSRRSATRERGAASAGLSAIGDSLDEPSGHAQRSRRHARRRAKAAGVGRQPGEAARRCRRFDSAPDCRSSPAIPAVRIGLSGTGACSRFRAVRFTSGAFCPSICATSTLLTVCPRHSLAALTMQTVPLRRASAVQQELRDVPALRRAHESRPLLCSAAAAIASADAPAAIADSTNARPTALEQPRPRRHAHQQLFRPADADAPFIHALGAAFAIEHAIIDLPSQHAESGQLRSQTIRARCA